MNINLNRSPVISGRSYSWCWLVFALSLLCLRLVFVLFSFLFAWLAWYSLGSVLVLVSVLFRIFVAWLAWCSRVGLGYIKSLPFCSCLERALEESHGPCVVPPTIDIFLTHFSLSSHKESPNWVPEMDPFASKPALGVNLVWSTRFVYPSPRLTNFCHISV